MLMIIKTLVLLIGLGSLCCCNLWDNIFSQSQASSPILFSSSINFKFPINYQQIAFEGTFDFNSELDIVTVIFQKNVLFMNLQIGRLQLDVKQLMVTFTVVGQECKKYVLVWDKDFPDRKPTPNIQQKLFLMNLLFEFKGRNSKNSTINEYVMMPDLIIDHNKTHQQFERNILMQVDNKGTILRIYDSPKKTKQVPFSLKSKMAKKMQCAGEPKQVTRQELIQAVRNGIQNKDYEKIPGFDPARLPKIPGLDTLDLDDLNLRK